MTKAELVARVAQKTQMTQQQTAGVVDLLLASIVEALQAGDKVELRGFVSFRRRARRLRQGRNPKTGDIAEVQVYCQRRLRLRWLRALNRAVPAVAISL